MAKATVWRKARDVSGLPAHSPNLGRPQPRSCRPTAACPPAVVLQFYSAMALQNLSAVDIHGHVENPMQTVLHPPMGAGHRAEVLGAERGAQQVVGGISTDLGADLAGAEHAANGSQPGPGMSLLQPSDVG